MPQIRQIGREIGHWIETHENLLGNQVKAREFLSAVETIGIETTKQELFIDNARKDAINCPSFNQIVFNIDRFEALKSRASRWGLISHEIFGILRINDSNYAYSSIIAKAALSDGTSDPVIDHLRTVFDHAVLPTQADLHEKKQWVCNEYSAKTNDLTQTKLQRSYKFTPFDGLYENLGTADAKTFASSDTFGFAAKEDSERMSFLRVDPTTHDLVVERTRLIDGPSYGLHQVSVSDSGRYALSYVVCPYQLLGSKSKSDVPSIGSPARECGIEGDVAQRAYDCHMSKQPARVRWTLVSRQKRSPQSKEFFERWRDESTEIIWDESSQSHKDGRTMGVDSIGALCTHGRLLPTVRQLLLALDHGALEVLPDWRYHQGLIYDPLVHDGFYFAASETSVGPVVDVLGDSQEYESAPPQLRIAYRCIEQ